MLSLNTVIAIDMGHSLSSSDYGSVGLKHESLLTREVGKKVISKLRSLGYKVIDCTIDTPSSLSESLAYRVNKANNNGANFYLSIHFNAFNGNAHGTEIFTYGGKEIPEARAILNNIVSMGYYNRGLKDGKGLYVVRNVNCISSLLECCFIDSKSDMDKFNSDKFADAIVKGLTGKGVITPTPTSSQSRILKLTNPLMYGEDVKELQQDLVALGFNLKIDSYFGNDTKQAVLKYQQLHKDLICDGIVGDSTRKSISVAIANKKKSTTQSKTEQKEDDTFYKVQIGAFSNKDNADKLLKDLKEKGINGYVKQD